MATFYGKHSELTAQIIGAFYQVHGELGYGFSEKVYENSLALVLRECGYRVEQQKPITVYYGGRVVGEYIADLVVDGIVLLELKSMRCLTDQHEAQLLNYLKATEIEVGLLLNFGPKGEFKRKVFDNDKKGSLNWLDPKVALKAKSV